jgi:hypothetical protein
MAIKKREAESEDTFLKTAARAVGDTLGKLAVKTGLAHEEKPKPAAQPKKPAAGRASGAAKRPSQPIAKSAAVKKSVAAKKTVAVKKLPAKKTTGKTTKGKR